MQTNKLTNGDISKNFDFVLLVDEKGEKIGKISSEEALNMANDKELDLVLVQNKEVPVCKIINFEKEIYNKKKKNHAPKSKKVKEVRIRPQTGEHDLQTKIKQIEKFLTKGNPVKIALKFKQRQFNIPSLQKTMDEFVEKISIPIKKEGNMKTSHGDVSLIIRGEKKEK